MSPSNSDEPEILASDLKVEVWTSGPAYKPNYIVRLLHVPTGHMAGSEAHESRIQAMRQAMENLREALDGR